MFVPVSLLALSSFASAPRPQEVPLHEVTWPEPVACISPGGWADMITRAESNLAWLEARGLLPASYAGGPVLFEWPLRPAAGFEDFGYHAISGYRDHAQGAGAVLDYDCGARTYDGHNGTDYVSFPFHWYKMDHDQVEIVAAAGGVIFDRVDGMNDRSCTPGGSSNKIAILHDDGTRGWYLHMKQGSVTNKGIGQTVVTGEYLGIVGSSGNSALPHLHFDVRDSNWVTFDPYTSDCNGLPGGSRWATQRPYYDSAINAVRTHGAPPEYPPCPQQEIPHFQDVFRGGDTVYVGIYHRDLLGGQVVDFQLIRPDGASVADTSYSGPAPHYAAAAALPSYELPRFAQAGTWTARVDYLDESYEWSFQVLARAQPTLGRVPLPGPMGQVLSVQRAMERIALDTVLGR